MQYRHDIQVFNSGMERYITGVAIFNNPEYMQPIHAQPVVSEYRERISDHARELMRLGSLAALGAVVTPVNNTGDDIDKVQTSSRRYASAFYRDPEIVQGLIVLTGNKLLPQMQPLGLIDPDVYPVLAQNGDPDVKRFMDGIGVSSFFDDLDLAERIPDQPTKQLAAGSVEGIEYTAVSDPLIADMQK